MVMVVLVGMLGPLGRVSVLVLLGIRTGVKVGQIYSGAPRHQLRFGAGWCSNGRGRPLLETEYMDMCPIVS